jgi:hypothetical protein
MKLNEQQIEQVRQYIRRRGFEQQEVQSEIVDHVASAVEAEMSEDRDISIEEAIYNVHCSFGLFGFENIERAVTAGIREHLWQYYKNSFLKLWNTKRIFLNLITACLLFVLFNTLLQTIPYPESSLYLLFVMTAISCSPLVYHFRLFRNWKKLSMVTGKLLISYATAGFWISLLLQYSYLWYETPFMDGILIISSLWLSTNLFAGLSMVSEIYKWTHDRWLKYQP